MSTISPPAPVNPELLVWAREEAGFSPEGAARKAHVRLMKLINWEDGTEEITFAQLQRLALLYRRPVAIFFLPEPPAEAKVEREFRRLSGLPMRRESPALRYTLRNALFRRETALQLYEELGERPSPFIAAAQLTDSTAVFGAKIRELLNITWQQQLDAPGDYAALALWKRAIEKQGILVFQTSGRTTKVGLEEMRGISTLHRELPIIILNSLDTPYGRIFTLLHEFAHLLLANAGHVTSQAETHMLPEVRRLELRCNHAAAASLMPEHEFLEEIGHYHDAYSGDGNTLRRISARIKVSQEAIFRHLVTLKKASVAVYRKKRRAWHQQKSHVLATPPGQIPIETRVISAAGRPFVDLVLRSYRRELISGADLSNFLGMKLSFIDRLDRVLWSGPGALAV